MSIKGSEDIWYENIQQSFTYSNYYNVLPLENMSIQEKLNALVRFFVYLGIFLALVKSDYRYLFLGIVAIIISIVVNEYEKNKHSVNEKFLKENQLEIVDNSVCSRTTVDNPFMNPSIADIMLNPEHPQACDLGNKEIREKVETNFNARLFRDVNDIYGKYASQRQFYTVPVTTIPGDQTGFGNWLYNRGPSCKDGNGNQCWRNIGELSLSNRISSGGNPSAGGSA